MQEATVSSFGMKIFTAARPAEYLTADRIVGLAEYSIAPDPKSILSPIGFEEMRPDLEGRAADWAVC